MITLLLKRYRGMILSSLLFFYLGCGIALSFIKMECASDISNLEFRSKNSSIYEKTEYAVLVISSPDNEMKRDAIRATWANFINNIFIENGETLFKWNNSRLGKNKKTDLIKIFFVIGTQNLEKDKLIKIDNELSRSNDLLLLNKFEDSYENLTLKLLYSLDFLSNNLKQLKYVIKCDDDSFVRVDLIVKDLEAFGPKMDDASISSYVTYKETAQNQKGLYWGYFNGRAQVFLSGKWQEKKWFLCDTYLPYALGGGYVISNSIVDYISRNLEYLSIYNSEDVSMGVWTAALNGINRVHDTRFDTQWKSRGCDNNMLIRHKQSPSDMLQMYKNLIETKGLGLCKSQSVLRKSYKYNWNVLPSMCCK
ncbi:unnamed protein product [Danaus chrysippus]|uniref:Hexosyltransferase n=1 Tax=Danaus chrysippus TaxID=151541 RepID=A0A8J2QZS3_9NEOP|nr:unnamed protein product [Danaus chrysippus]